ncbi:MotA/TolQ/ExbB proton channel family protein [uncultured Psychroserpens sp.]|uniref:MotA/TolQ/ExbB proton channel family protein n=1 Tax=uncultured Psychroserpens sp. TaxID=255436 RepID=UPI00262D3BA6|nr:MotA/TolQ/ExbB proton channel family protein [uncultured Psychroserpens sp.]
MNTLTMTSKSLSITANMFVDGGPLFMTLILICLLASLFFLVRGFANVKKSLEISNKMLKLASDASLLGLVMGFLASIIGLITAFDSVEAMGDPDPSIFAGGLKISLLTASFGLFTFVVARIGIIILRMMSNTNDK